MAFSINGRIYHSSLGLALIVLGPAGLGSHDIFTIKSSASLGTLFFHKYLGNDILLDIYTNKSPLLGYSPCTPSSRVHCIVLNRSKV